MDIVIISGGQAHLDVQLRLVCNEVASEALVRCYVPEHRQHKVRWGKHPLWIGLCEFCKFTQIFDVASIVSWVPLFGSFALSLNAWMIGEEYAPRLELREFITP